MKIDLYKPVFPYFYIIFIILSVIAGNLQELDSSNIPILITTAILIVASIQILLNLTVQSWHKSAFICYIILLCIFEFNKIYNLTINKFTLLTHKEHIVVFTAMWIIFCYLIARIGCKNNRLLYKITFPFNTFYFILLLTTFLQIIPFEFIRYNYRDTVLQYPKIKALEIPFVKKPNIYYLIFDRYPSNDVLKIYFHYDNSDFIHELKKRGFFVVPQARSNYLKTAHSLSSSLNMQHLNSLSKVLGEKNSDWFPLYNSLINYAVQKKLKVEEYRYVHMGSWWEPTRKNTNADKNINLYAQSEFTNMIFHNSLLSSWIPFFNKRYQQWKRIQHKFNKLEKLILFKNSQYIFGHFLVPHPPLVINEDGSFISMDTLQQSGFSKNFINQVKFTNMRILAFIDHVLAQPGERPIIVIQADEGPFPDEYRKNEKFFDWSQASDEQLLMKTSILNAYLLPPMAQAKLDAKFTPVNTFRLIFSELTRTEFDRLPDESYLFPSSQNLYQFIPITERIRQNITTDIEN